MGEGEEEDLETLGAATSSNGRKLTNGGCRRAAQNTHSRDQLVASCVKHNEPTTTAQLTNPLSDWI